MASNVSTIEHLIVNRVEVLRDGCSGCGEEFASGPAGAPVLSAAVEPNDRTYIFCRGCGDSIMGHVMTQAVRERYGWDWIVPLGGTLGQSGRVNIDACAPAAKHERFGEFGKTYPSERAAIIGFLCQLHAGEFNGAEAFTGWAAVCATDWIRSGLRMIAEREAYHARIFGQRLQELGCESPDEVEVGRSFRDYLGDPGIPDSEKLLRLSERFGDPKDAIKPISYFAALIKDDIETRDALLLFAQDELSTFNWVHQTCRALFSSDTSLPN